MYGLFDRKRADVNAVRTQPSAPKLLNHCPVRAANVKHGVQVAGKASETADGGEQMAGVVEVGIIMVADAVQSIVELLPLRRVFCCSSSSGAAAQ